MLDLECSVFFQCKVVCFEFVITTPYISIAARLIYCFMFLSLLEYVCFYFFNHTTRRRKYLLCPEVIKNLKVNFILVSNVAKQLVHLALIEINGVVRVYEGQVPSTCK